MRMAEPELAYLRSMGLHITEKCDGCGRILNQPHRYTVAGKSGAYCTAICRDKAILGAKAERVASGARCFRCRQHKQPGSLYCLGCQPFADPHGQTAVNPVEAERLCMVCGEPVPVLRRASGSATCDTSCAGALRQRRRREHGTGNRSAIHGLSMNPGNAPARAMPFVKTSLQFTDY